MFVPKWLRKVEDIRLYIADAPNFSKDMRDSSSNFLKKCLTKTFESNNSLFSNLIKSEEMICKALLKFYPTKNLSIRCLKTCGM